MVGKRNEIDFGTVFVTGDADLGRLTSEFEKAVQVNGDTIIEDGAYKHKHSSGDRPVRVKVILEVVGA